MRVLRIYLQIFSLIGFSLLFLAAPVSGEMKIDSFSPESGTNNGVVTVTLTGTGFKSESISNIWLNCSGLERIFCASYMIISDTQLSASFPLSGQIPGSYLIFIGTGSSVKYMSKTPFRIFYPYPPSISKITPESGMITDQPFTCTVNGSNFLLNSDVKLVNRSGTIFPSTTSYIDYNQLSSTFSARLDKGDRYLVQVINPDTQVSSEEVYFTVIDLPPVITDVTPDYGIRTDSSCELTVTGSGFQDGCIVNLHDSTGGLLFKNTGDAFVSDDGTQLSCVFDLSAISIGEFQVVLKNPDDQESKEHIFFTIYPEPERKYPITIVSGPGGITDPKGIISAVESSNLVIAFYPDPEYSIHSVYLDGIIQEGGDPYILKDIHASHEVYVDFSKNDPIPDPTQGPVPTPSVNYSIMASSDLGSEIYPTGMISVPEGSDLPFRIEVKQGFHLIDTLIDNTSTGGMDFWTFENVRSNHTINTQSERNNSPQWAHFEPVNTSGKAPLVVTFNSQDLVDDEYEFWDFGDGTTGYGKEAIHRYNHPGNYTVGHQVVFAKFSSWCKKEGIIRVY